jgi:hypothetical protein
VRRVLASLSVLTATTLSAALGAVVVAPTAEAAAPPYKGANNRAVQDDFNGDGYRDLAVGIPGASRGDDDLVGAVDVLYGSKSGLSAARHQVVTQASAGVPGTPEVGDKFGQVLASADLDGDGYADLVVGDPAENVSGHDWWGSVTVLWGGPGGLSGGTTLSRPADWDPDGVDRCAYGTALATGDVDGDGHTDLAIGSYCGGLLLNGPITRSGEPAAVTARSHVGEARGVAVGDVNGDGKAEVFWLQGPSHSDLKGGVFEENGTADPTELTAANGYLGEIGDVNGDGYGDLVTGVPDDDYLQNVTVGAAHKGGEVEVLYGGPQGIGPAQKPRVIDQDTAGVPGTGENGDQFGAALSVADTNGDGYADVLVGSPAEAIGSKVAGAVTLLRGSKAGLTGTGAVSYNQGSAHIPGTPETNDFLGTAVHLADLNGDGHPEAAVGIPGENGVGCVLTLPGATGGPSAVKSADICAGQVGVTTNLTGDGLGAVLTSAQSDL